MNLQINKPPLVDTSEIRYAVVNFIHQEVLSQNHLTIGEAFNSAAEDYSTTRGLVVVSTKNDKILGEVSPNGKFKKSTIKLPATIWGGAKHPFFDPAIAKRTTETASDVLVKLNMELLSCVK